MKKKKLEKNVCMILSLIFVTLIIIQNQYVYMYFDDWGYASLSYGWNGNQAGMSYTSKDIFKFLSWHYMNWGGRILYFFFEIVIFRFSGLMSMQIIQAIIIILILIVSGKIVEESGNKNSMLCIALALMLYGTIHIKTLSDGVYWYSASVLYVWPLFPFFLSIYLYMKNQNKEVKWRNILCILLNFLAAFSQEQIAVAMIVFMALTVIESLYEKKHISYYVIGMCISSVIGGALTILAPGNFKRTEIYPNFYGENFLIRTIKNVGLLINSNIGVYNWGFILIFTFFCSVAMAKYFKSKKLAIVTVVFLCYFIGEQFLPISKEMGIIPRGIWLLIYFPMLVRYYYSKKSFVILNLLLAGVCSQAMMIVSPTIPIRSHIVMELILHIILIESMVWMYREISAGSKEQRAITFSIVVVTVCVVCNMIFVTSGYAKNYKVHHENQCMLEETRAQYKNGNNVQEVRLWKLVDDKFANKMPYQEGYDYAEEWMKNYYELLSEIKIEWQ